jgi:FAD/FMN-containing dehydrogenase
MVLIASSSGVDNVIELNVVTSAGEYLTVNSHSHPDLFWALRGGGGGTYGIVTSVTYRTHPSVPLTGIFFSANSSNNATFKKLCTEFVRIHPDLSDAGFSGYAQTSPHELQVVYIAPNMSQAQANQTIDPFFAFAQNLTSEGLNRACASQRHLTRFTRGTHNYPRLMNRLGGLQKWHRG